MKIVFPEAKVMDKHLPETIAGFINKSYLKSQIVLKRVGMKKIDHIDKEATYKNIFHVAYYKDDFPVND